MLRVVFAFVVLASFKSTALTEEVRHSFLTADSSKKRIAIIDESGTTSWEMQIGPLHDLHRLPNGNVLLQTNWTRIVEIDPSTNDVVWEYDSAQQNGNLGKKVEVHAFQRLTDGNTMIAESGVSRIIEVDQFGKIVHELALRVSKPHPHRDTRLVRKLPNGNYLVCHEGDGLVREYGPDGDTIWEFPVPLFGKERAPGHGPEAYGNQCFSALRLSNGNTLISTGNGHSVIEVSHDGEVVWKLKQTDLRNITLAWVTTLQQLPNGNLVIGNCHAGPENPQIIELTRGKEVVWTFNDFERFGNALTNTQVLTTNGNAFVALPGRDR